MVKERTESLNQAEDQLSDLYEIILYNDDYNTFDFVIETLIEVCDHDPESAEQCALIAHYKGKCAVKSGDLEALKPINKEMNDRGLTSSIK